MRRRYGRKGWRCATEPLKKPELLSPAGDFESLQAACAYGADAVYVGGTSFSMRGAPQNFGPETLPKAVEYAHARGVRLYLTCNTLPRSSELPALPEFLAAAKRAGADALIVTDLGVLELAKKFAPGVELHVSTQAGVVNYAAANALFALGASRIVAARELSLAELAELRAQTPRALSVEAFVHGAMCVSFSGRCLLSDYLTGRDANRGVCAQPCRWRYALSEETRPGEYFPVFEDASGTTILNARDLCMLGHIPELARAGVGSFKIEGRAKSAYYVAVVTNAYRMAIDGWARQGSAWRCPPELLREADAVSHRPYCTGFYFGPAEKGDYAGSGYLRSFEVCADSCEGPLWTVRNPFSPGESFELLEPGKPGRAVELRSLRDERGRPLARAQSPGMRVLPELSEQAQPFALLRRAVRGPSIGG